MGVRIILEPILAGRSAFILFTLAVMASASVGGRRPGTVATILGALAGTYLFVEPYGSFDVDEVRFLLQTMLFLVVGGGISYLAGELQNARMSAESRAEEAHRARELAEHSAEEAAAALERVRVLSGLLPICASCKKIRDDHGSWEQLEVYIKSHTDAEFTHGLCPECADEFESQM
jgi:K+-sensing histidine kinase KdpD